MFMTGKGIILFLLSFGQLECLIFYALLTRYLFITRVFPDWLPFHPHRWWIHTRAVYIPLSYIYGARFKMQENDLILSLREVWSMLSSLKSL